MDDRNNFSNEKYLAARDRLVERSENFINNIYLDTMGLSNCWDRRIVG